MPGTTTFVLTGDSSRLEKLVKLIDEISNAEIRIGFLAGKGADDAHKDHDGQETDETVVQIAERHEFGLGVPERSFLRSTADDERKNISTAAQRLAVRVIDGDLAALPMLEQLGAFMQAKVQRTIQKGVPPPNSPVTIAAKGSDKPLIDTGQMVQSIRYGVHWKKGGK